MKQGKKQKYSRLLSLLLAFVIVFTMMPAVAWADGGSNEIEIITGISAGIGRVDKVTIKNISGTQAPSGNKQEWNVELNSSVDKLELDVVFYSTLPKKITARIKDLSTGTSLIASEPTLNTLESLGNKQYKGTFEITPNWIGNKTSILIVPVNGTTELATYAAKINISKPAQTNNPPYLNNVPSSVDYPIVKGRTYNVDLSNIFADIEQTSLKYMAKVGDDEFIDLSSSQFSYTAVEDVESTVPIVFKAKDDDELESPTYTVNLQVQTNFPPRVIIGIEKTIDYTIKAGKAFNIDLTQIFEELNENDSTSYVVKYSETEEFVAADSQFSYVPEEVGNETLVFKAYDESDYSDEYTVNLDVVRNRIPLLKTEKAHEKKTIIVGNTYNLTMSDIFEDLDGDELTYSVSLNGTEAEIINELVYNCSTEEIAETKYTFTANDGMDSATYELSLNVVDASAEYEMTVNVPKELQPVFYVTDGFNSDGTDKAGLQLQAEVGTENNGMIPYSISVPVTAEYISIRAGEAGIAIKATADASMDLIYAKAEVKDFNDNTVAGTIKVIYDNHTATADVNNYYILNTGDKYQYVFSPEDSSTYAETSDGIVLEGSSAIVLRVKYKNQKTITVSTGAAAELYKYNKYYDYDKLESKAVLDNKNGTTTFYFSATGKLSYRVTKNGKITKGGYVTDSDVTALYSDADLLPTVRPVYSETAYDNKYIAEDSVLLNVNRHNNLVLSVDDTKILKAYRAWEIIMYDYENMIINPDFHFDIVTGNDVVKLTDIESKGNGRNDWKTITPLKEGTAIIEVSYDAIEISGGSFSGVYGASDPSRTGLVVVQVGDDHADVDFGIDCYSAIGMSSMSTAKWDAELDTLYFTGDNAELELSPSISDGIVETVEVSNNKGLTWACITEKEGKYIAPIVSGNNIIKVTTDKGVAYQVVRGDKISVKLTEVSKKSDRDGIVEAGETIRITFDGLHMPIPKISGNYNPGSAGLKYSSEECDVTGTSVGNYRFVSEGNYVEIIVPEDEEKIVLTEGFIKLSVIGLAAFASDEEGDSHRNIPDDGCSTRGNGSSINNRSILPEVVITVGQETAPNTAPTVKPDAVTTERIKLGQNFALNPETLFTDAESNELTFTVSVDNGNAEVIGSNYKFRPDSVGKYYLKFTASDGKLDCEHVVELTVESAVSEEENKELTFDISGSQIDGYVYVSFEDNAVRKQGETGLKYPIALGEIIPVTKVPFHNGDSIATVTVRLLKALKIGYTYTGTVDSNFYLASIKNFEVDNTPYGEMGQHDAGAGSGWMITQNGVFIDKGTSDFKVTNNDIIKWQYTCQLGADIGDPFFDDKKEDEEVKDVTTSGGAAAGAGAAGATGEPVTTTTPTEVTLVGSTATATIKKENVTETLKQATENKAAEIILQVSANDTKGAAKVEVKIDTQTVKDIVEDTAAVLTVKTENGTVSLDKETLKTVAAEAVGATVSLEVVKVEKPTEAHKKAAGENGHVIQLVIKSGDKTISSFNEGKATVTVAIPFKLDGKKVAAIHIADDGTIEHLKGEQVTVNGIKHYRFDTPHFSTFALVDADEIGLEAETQPEVMSAEEVKELIADLSLVARSAKVKKGIKVTLKLDAGDKAIIEALEEEGFTVKYKFYRSTKKSSKYQAKLTSKKASYTNTGGKKGTKYYYKAIAQVYDAEGKLIAKTALKQCKYASRTWK